MLMLFLLLLFFHYLADYPLQGDFVARAKNPAEPVPGVPYRHILFAHAYIHAGFVGFACWLFTGMWWIMFLELAAHYVIDSQKCKGEITFAKDQWLHIGCKALWAVLAVGISGMLIY